MVAKQNHIARPRARANALPPLFALCWALLSGPALAAPEIDTRPVPVGPTSSALPEGWQHGAFMAIFVRAWRDSDGDGIGDLRGLTMSLDHLQELGVRGIWLLPITANADGDHGYATTDFRAIAPEYGTLADFDALILEAHQRGIGVIMDYVINHSAAQHPMFTEALKGPDNPFRPWFVWAGQMPQGWDIWGKNPWYAAEAQPWTYSGDVKLMPPPPLGASNFYFGTFGPQMPDFNFRHPPVLQYHQDSLRFWLNRGLDGYRLDAVPHLLEGDAVRWNDQPESRVLTKQLQDLIKGYQHRYVVCEATAEPAAYGDPGVCGGAFAFGFVHHYVGAAQGQPASVQRVATHYSAGPQAASPTMATFLSNHDIFAGRRLWDQVGGDVRAYKLAAAGYLLQPGTPFIYYGEDIGQAGVPGLEGDRPLRAPYSWTADTATAGFTTGTPFRAVAPNAATNNLQAQRADPQSIFNFYKAMLKLRNGLPSLARGRQEHDFAQGLVAGWQRVHEGERTLVLINYGTQLAQAEMQNLPANARLLSAFPEGGAQAARANAAGEASLWLGPQAVRVLRVDSGAKRAARTGTQRSKAQAQKAKSAQATAKKAKKAKKAKTGRPASKAKAGKAAQKPAAR